MKLSRRNLWPNIIFEIRELLSSSSKGSTWSTGIGTEIRCPSSRMLMEVGGVRGSMVEINYDTKHKKMDKLSEKIIWLLYSPDGLAFKYKESG